MVHVGQYNYAVVLACWLQLNSHVHEHVILCLATTAVYTHMWVDLHNIASSVHAWFLLILIAKLG